LIWFRHDKKTLHGTDGRLVRRYQQLVKEHANSTEKLAAGLRSLPHASKSSFASTQAAWRFYQNDKVSLSKLSEPLLETAHDGISSHCTSYSNSSKE